MHFCHLYKIPPGRLLNYIEEV